MAKTISAYDMAMSDAIYGPSDRYVSRKRLQSMLDHEFDLLLKRLDKTRGDKCTFFAFANTVATKQVSGPAWKKARAGSASNFRFIRTATLPPSSFMCGLLDWETPPPAGSASASSASTSSTARFISTTTR